ncbi:MAG: hypothetical protein V2J55_15440 [Candidatus Competibacteraceae bacterium]|jgi:hypothetical protein|nr:hypothetical protein [Candidatus Competibacteraceae bacterium]
MRLIFFISFLLLLQSCGGGDGSSRQDNNKPGELKAVVVPGMDLYGWYSEDYSTENNDLAELVSYTNTMLASTIEQAKLAVDADFPNVIYRYEHYQITDRMETIPVDPDEFRNSYFLAYQQFLWELKDALVAQGIYDQVDYFFILDEPALRRDVILDQAFLERYVLEFDQVFPDKYSMIAFSEDPDSTDPKRGAHMSPPSTVDYLIMVPYFWNNDMPCDSAALRQYLYTDYPNSNLDWGLQWGKPVIVAGDAMIRRDEPPRFCYIDEVFALVSEDERIQGILWFIYDERWSIAEGRLKGSKQSPSFVAAVKALTAEY